MRKLAILIVATALTSIPAFAACKPDVGPKNPQVCIYRVLQWDEQTQTYKTVFVASPDRVTADYGERVKFKFDNWGGKLKIVPLTTVLDNIDRPSKAEWSGTAMKFSTQTSTKYKIIDEDTGEETDPTIIIEPFIESQGGPKGGTPRTTLHKE